MASLVYRAHPVPSTLQDFVFDFGALTDARELCYVLSMASKALPSDTKVEHEMIAALVCRAHAIVRQCEGDSSATSLRDVRRFLQLTIWFRQNFPKVGEKMKERAAQLLQQRALAAPQGGKKDLAAADKKHTPCGLSSLAVSGIVFNFILFILILKRLIFHFSLSRMQTSTVLALAHVYFYRLSTGEQRQSLWSAMQRTVNDNWTRELLSLG